MNRFEKLLKEYANFIELPSSALILTELEMLALVHDITIHIYESKTSSFKLQGTLHRGRDNTEYLILYERGGEWRRLKANTNLQHFCSKFEPDLFLCQPVQTISFSNLMKWSEMNGCHEETSIHTSLMMLNPEDGDTPDELSRLLLVHLKEMTTMNKDDGQINELASDIRLLSERVVEYNSQNISPIFYLHIVAKCKPHEWKYEFLLLDIEEHLTSPLKLRERKLWRNELIYNLDDRIMSLLRERLLTSKTCSFSLLEPENFEQMLKMLAEESCLSVIGSSIDRGGQVTNCGWGGDCVCSFRKKS